MLPWLSLSFPSPLFRLPEREFLSLVFVAEELHFPSLRYPFFKNSIAGVNWIYLNVSEMRKRNRGMGISQYIRKLRESSIDQSRNFMT